MFTKLCKLSHDLHASIYGYAKTAIIVHKAELSRLRLLFLLYLLVFKVLVNIKNNFSPYTNNLDPLPDGWNKVKKYEAIPFKCDYKSHCIFCEQTYSLNSDPHVANHSRWAYISLLCLAVTLVCHLNIRYT